MKREQPWSVGQRKIILERCPFNADHTGTSAAVLQFEVPAGGNIKTAAEALWWAFTTITTVAYGDYFPVTPEGRIVGALLMTAGVGLFGILSGFVASWFLAPSQHQQESELSAVRGELAALRRAMESRGGAA